MPGFARRAKILNVSSTENLKSEGREILIQSKRVVRVTQRHIIVIPLCSSVTSVVKDVLQHAGAVRCFKSIDPTSVIPSATDGSGIQTVLNTSISLHAPTFPVTLTARIQAR